jgi:hypothetical protein
VLNTDWGDNGHLQPLPVSYIGFMAGAAMSWRAEDARAPLELPVAEWLDAFVYDDATGRLARVTRDLGNAYREMGFRPHNASALFYFVAGRPSQPISLPGTSAEHFDATLAYLERLDAELALAKPVGDESQRAQAELLWASDLLKTACRIGKARLPLGFEAPVSALDAGTRERLAAELAPLIERYRALWLVRNRPGGLRESAGQMERVLKQLLASS